MQSFFCSVLVLLLANTFGHALPFGPDDIYLGPSSLPDDYFDDIPFLTNKQTENIRKTYTGLYDFYQRLARANYPEASDRHVRAPVLRRKLYSNLKERVRAAQRFNAKSQGKAVPEKTVIPPLVEPGDSDSRLEKERQALRGPLLRQLAGTRAKLEQVQMRACQAERQAAEKLKEAANCRGRAIELEEQIALIERLLASVEGRGNSAAPSNSPIGQGDDLQDRGNRFSLQLLSPQRAIEFVKDDRVNPLARMARYLTPNSNAPARSGRKSPRLQIRY